MYFDVETPDGMDTLDWNPSSSSDYDTSDEKLMDQELRSLMRDVDEHEIALQDSQFPGPRRSPRLMERFTAAAAHAQIAPEGGLEGCQKTLAQYASKVKWHTSVQEQLHMFKEESTRLEKSMNSLPKRSKPKYASWDIQDLLDFEDPEVPQDQKMDIEFSYDAADHSDPKDMDLDQTDADFFQPAPTHWKQIMTLPLHLRQH